MKMTRGKKRDNKKVWTIGIEYNENWSRERNKRQKIKLVSKRYMRKMIKQGSEFYNLGDWGTKQETLSKLPPPKIGISLEKRIKFLDHV